MLLCIHSTAYNGMWFLILHQSLFVETINGCELPAISFGHNVIIALVRVMIQFKGLV